MDKKPEKTGRKQDGRFRKGESGNPKGRPAGARNKTTVAAQSLLNGQANALTQQAIDLALSGNIAALRICLDRLLPIRRRPEISIDIGELKSVQDAQHAFSVMAQALREGQISADDIAAITSLLDQFLRVTEMIEFEHRLYAVEEAIENASKDKFTAT